jgi:fructuronate reductase
VSSRLSNATWRAAYDRVALRPGVVHLGLGAFHRAHQAPVFDGFAERGDRRWGIVGVAMRSPELVTALAGQDGLYSLLERGPGGAGTPRVIAALTACHVAARDAAAVVAAIADADARIVTLTVTEKGYLDHGPTAPAGLIAAALDRRRAAGLGPMTIMSCDNRADNGPFTRAAVLTAARQAGVADAALRWIDEAVAFPSTMVDRITPAATAATIDLASDALGLRDAAAICTEPFWQWVIEDRFAGERPDFAAAGVQVVAAVAPWERAKLRLLNAAHSALAYGGLLRGHAFVHQAIADPELAALVEAMWDEAAATIDRTMVDVPAYRRALRTRFANPALHHALIQIAGDGSQKLPPRILSTMADRREMGLDSPALARAAAMWMQALATVGGLADPLLAELRTIAVGSDPAAPLLRGIGAPDGLSDAIAPALARLRGR